MIVKCHQRNLKRLLSRSYHKNCLQGVILEQSESYCLLLPKYECHGLLVPTGCSPDVVHLIICASEVFWCKFWITISDVSKEAFFEDASILLIFFNFLKGCHDENLPKVDCMVTFGVGNDFS